MMWLSMFLYEGSKEQFSQGPCRCRCFCSKGGVGSNSDDYNQNSARLAEVLMNNMFNSLRIQQIAQCWVPYLFLPVLKFFLCSKLISKDCFKN